MPLRWDGIADSSAQPDAVWLSRPVVADAKARRWKPLRKGDAQRLNQATKSNTVYVDGGRSRLCLETMTMEPTYPTVASVSQEVCRAVWFWRGNEPVSNTSGNHRTPQIEFRDGTTVDSMYDLIPITNVEDELQIESLYQTIVQATSSLGKGVQSILNEERDLENGTLKVQVQYKNETLSLRKVPKQQNWLSNITAATQKNSFTLQRGYSEYRVPQEELEVQLGPVRHLVFVIHGIGEAFFQRDDVQIAGLVDQTHALRGDVQKKQLARWKQQKPPSPTPPPRMEFIPIEWYHCLHGDGNADFVNQLQRITLPTISALRTIANDVLLDVLLYCTPSFCETVLQTVVQQIQSAYTTFTQDVFPEFLTNGGTISLMGHSLGSVIAWDLLAILKEAEEPSSRCEPTESTTTDPPFALHAASTSSSFGPPLATRATSHLRLPFTPKYTLLLGSPVGLFLTLRNAPALFQKEAVPSEENVPSSFSLPTRLYNIFHPSDPVAYRIEPLLLRPGLDIPPPAYLTVPGEEVRLHVKAKQLTDRVRKSFLDPSQPTSWVSLVESAVSALEPPSEARAAATSSRNRGPQFPLGGGPDNLRVDYSLQPGLVESEYIRYVVLGWFF
jgi:DDHD domain